MQGLHNFPLTKQSSPSKEGITASSADRTPDRDGLFASMRSQNNICPFSAYTSQRERSTMLDDVLFVRGRIVRIFENS
jgi:hypothetical protein